MDTAARRHDDGVEGDERAARWNLWSIRGVSHAHIQQLARRHPVSELWSMREEAAARSIDSCDPGSETRERLLERVNGGDDPRGRYRRELEALPDKAHLVHVADDAYPSRLFDLDDPPTFLYVRGAPDAACNRPTMATVGTRSVDVEDARLASRIVHRVVEAGVAVVSGGARGVDTVAHETCLDADTPTVAFLPGGLDQPTPKSNLELFERTAEGGAVMTEYPLGVDVRRYHFPRRNRLIAALGDVTFVVRGDVDSGTMLTAEAALDIGRPLGALVGGLDEPLAAGCLKLIVEEGAQALRHGDDVLDHLFARTFEHDDGARGEEATSGNGGADAGEVGEDDPGTDDAPSTGDSAASPPQTPPTDAADASSHSTAGAAPEESTAGSAPARPAATSVPDDLSERASTLLEAAAELNDDVGDRTLHVDQLARELETSTDEVQSTLLEIELYGLASKSPGAQAYRFHA